MEVLEDLTGGDRSAFSSRGHVAIIVGEVGMLDQEHCLADFASQCRKCLTDKKGHPSKVMMANLHVDSITSATMLLDNPSAQLKAMDRGGSGSNDVGHIIQRLSRTW